MALVVAGSLGRRYASASIAQPHLVAGGTACGIITVADLTCQGVVQRDPENGIDWRRTAGLAVFGAWHYGGPCKGLYLLYDRVLGNSPTLRTAASKMVLDVYVHSPLLLVPSFYVITGVVKGQTIDESVAQLRREWFQAAFGTACFWTPACLINFRYVPQHSRILFVSVLSYAHKTWLSWLSNREHHAARSAAATARSAALPRPAVSYHPTGVP